MADSQMVQRWRMADLCALVPSTTPTIWRRTLIPELQRRGVVHRVGKGWFARRSDIEAALFPQPATPQP